jgi:ribosomal protein S18 acetylase RimI-like enzyme
MDVRDAEGSEIDRLARVWYEGWRDAHVAILSAELIRLRTLESFRDRLTQALSSVRVIGPLGDPLGFGMTKDAELYQLYVSAHSRRGGVGAALITDAEARLCASGVTTAWLACAIGNERAARFYEKHGWNRIGTMINRLETSSGPYLLEVWRYEKQLTSALASTPLT